MTNILRLKGRSLGLLKGEAVRSTDGHVTVEEKHLGLFDDSDGAAIRVLSDYYHNTRKVLLVKSYCNTTIRQY